jgi:hypothetical protein
MLEIVGSALYVNNIQYVLCTNKNVDFSINGKIEKFRNNVDVRVLLLPLSLGFLVFLLLVLDKKINLFFCFFF